MNTLSIPNSSAKGTFCRASGSSLEIQAEDSFPSDEMDRLNEAEERLWREAARWFNGACVAIAVATVLVFRYPRVMAVILCIAVSAVIIVFLFCWAVYRGDPEIGVSDTQGRDNSTL